MLEKITLPLLPEGEPSWNRSASGQPVIVWVLAFVQEKFHNISPGDFESTFIKVRHSETRKGLGEKKQQERA